MAHTDHDFAQFVADAFDSEESVMIMLVLRQAGGLTAGEVLDRLERDFHVEQTDQRRLAEKRVELRLRDLVARGVVKHGHDNRFSDRTDEAGLTELADRLALEFETRRSQLNRMIYATASRARRLAEAFRL